MKTFFRQNLPNFAECSGRILILCLLLILSPNSPAGPTPFFGKFYNADGSPQTNVIQMQAWPPANNWTIYGTNMVYGGAVITLVPDTTGYFSNAAYANTYRLLVTNLNSGFYMTLLDTTNFLSIAVYATDTPTVGNILNGFGLVTNWLGYTPAPATYAGISNAQGFASATNNNAGIVFAQGFASATNSNGGIVSAQGFSSATNNNAGITAAQGFASATNGAAIVAPSARITGPLTLTSVPVAFTNGATVWYSSTNTVPGQNSNYVIFATSTNDPYAIYRLTNTATAGGTNWQRVL